jgi:hypothetical protein
VLWVVLACRGAQVSHWLTGFLEVPL